VRERKRGERCWNCFQGKKNDDY